MHTIPFVPTWRQVHTSNGQYVISMAASIQLLTGPVRTMVTRTASREFPHHCVDSVLVRTAHRSMWLRNLLTSLLILSRPVVQRTRISSPSTRGKTGWRCWMTCHNRPLFPAIDSVLLPNRRRIRSESRSCHGLHRVIFHHGLRSRD